MNGDKEHVLKISFLVVGRFGAAQSPKSSDESPEVEAGAKGASKN